MVSDDTNFVEDVFLHDRVTGHTVRASVGALEEEGLAVSSLPDIASNGRYTTFVSAAQLVETDTDTVADVYARAVPGLTIDGAVPDMLPIGQTTSVTLQGSHFQPGTTPYVSGGTVANVVVVDENTITFDVSVAAGEPAGARNVVITLFGSGAGALTGSSAFCSGCVTFF